MVQSKLSQANTDPDLNALMNPSYQLNLACSMWPNS